MCIRDRVKVEFVQAAFAAGCAAAGVQAAITQACLDAGGPATADEAAAVGSPVTCSDIAASYAAQAALDGDSANDCAEAIALATSTDAASLCSLAGNIGVATTATCADLAASYSDSALDPLFVGTAGITCTEYGNNFTNDCLETNGVPNTVNETELYLLNPAAVPATYGYFVTYNGTVFSSIANQAATGPIPCGDAGLVAFDNSDLTGDGVVDADDIQAFTAGCNPHLLVNDSDHDFDSACLADGDDSDCSGRLRLTFEPTCVPEIEARQIVAEFVNLLDICTRDGDVNYSCAA